MAAGGHIGNVTWKQIDIESCVIPLFLLILAWRIHFWHRLCILTSATIKIQDGCLRPYWKFNLKVNGHRNLYNITFPTKCGIESPFLASFLPEASIGLRVLSLPASVRQSVRPSVTKFVRAITHHPFKLGSPNLEHRCKRPWLRSLLFCGVIDLDLQGQI